MHVLIIYRIILKKELFFQEIIDLSCNIPMTYVICMCTKMPVLGKIVLSSYILSNWEKSEIFVVKIAN